LSETEDEIFSDQGEVTRQPSLSSPVNRENSPTRETSTGLERQPGLTLPDGERPSRHKEDETVSVIRTHSPIGAGDTTSNDDEAMQLQGGYSGDTPANETQRQVEVLRQALADTRDTSTLCNKFRDLHTKLVSTLKEIIGNHKMTAHDLIDDLYTQVVAQIGAPQSKREIKLKRAKGPKNQTGSKRKRKEVHIL
jgi:chromatin remodeling complex protein RSC6